MKNERKSCREFNLLSIGRNKKITGDGIRNAEEVEI
jgi:hypothetical protein